MKCCDRFVHVIVALSIGHMMINHQFGHSHADCLSIFRGNHVPTHEKCPFLLCRKVMGNEITDKGAQSKRNQMAGRPICLNLIPMWIHSICIHVSNLSIPLGTTVETPTMSLRHPTCHAPVLDYGVLNLM